LKLVVFCLSIKELENELESFAFVTAIGNKVFYGKIGLILIKVGFLIFKSLACRFKG